MERKEDKKTPSKSGLKRDNPDPTDPLDTESKGKKDHSWSGDESSQRRLKSCDRSDEKATSEPGLKRDYPDPTDPSDTESKAGKKDHSWSGDESSQRRLKRCDRSDEKAPSKPGLKRDNPDPTDPSDTESKGKKDHSWSGDESSQRRLKRCDRSDEKAPSEPGLKRENPDPTEPESKDEKAPSESGPKRESPEPASPELSKVEEELLAKLYDDKDEVFLWEEDSEEEMDSEDERNSVDGSNKTKNPILESIYCRYSIKNIAEEIVVDCQDLVTLAREFLGLIEKSDENDFETNKKRLDDLASRLLQNDNVLNALVECAILDPLFIDVFDAYKYKRHLRTDADNVVCRLRRDPLLGFVLENQNTEEDVLRGALSVGIGYWMKESYKEKLYKHSIYLKDDSCTSLENMEKNDFETAWQVKDDLFELRDEKKKLRQPPLEEKDDKKSSQSVFLSGELFLSDLDVLYKRFLRMAEELVVERPSLVVEARQLLEMIQKTDIEKGLLNKTATDLMGNKKVLDALIEHSIVDPLFVDVGSCLSHVIYRKEEEQGIENVDRLREDPLFGEVVKNQDTEENVLRGGLSVVFGYWFDQAFFVDKLTKHTIPLEGGLCASFPFNDDEEYEEDTEIKYQLLTRREKRRQRQSQKKANT